MNMFYYLHAIIANYFDGEDCHSPNDGKLKFEHETSNSMCSDICLATWKLTISSEVII